MVIYIKVLKVPLDECGMTEIIKLEKLQLQGFKNLLQILQRKQQ